MELNELIAVMAASIYRCRPKNSGVIWHTNPPEDYVDAVKKAKKIWEIVLAEEHND